MQKSTTRKKRKDAKNVKKRKKIRRFLEKNSRHFFKMQKN